MLRIFLTEKKSKKEVLSTAGVGHKLMESWKQPAREQQQDSSSSNNNLTM